MAKRSIEIYRPPEDLRKVDNKDDVPEMAKFLAGAEVDNCILHTECVNLDNLDIISEELGEITEIIGHELNKIQLAIGESTEHMRLTVQPVVKNLASKRNDIQNMRSTLENQLTTISKFREDIMNSAGNSKKVSEDYSKINVNIENAQRVLNVSFSFSLLWIYYSSFFSF